jgi:hypothetical protein
MTLGEYREPGPRRSAAVTAIAVVLKRDLYVCGDRARIVAGHVLDAALDELERAATTPGAS